MNATWGSVRKSLLFLFVAFLLNVNQAASQTLARIVEPIDNSRRITLSGNIHPLARPEFDRGAVVPAQPVTRILLLLQRSDAQEAALQSYLEQQHDKSSPNYHQWLTPTDFGAWYGPAEADIQAITQWLTSQGFTVNQVYSGKTVIEFSGNAAQVQSAFGANLHNYEVNGKTYVANANDPQIPAALAPGVAGIVSLNNFPRHAHVLRAGTAQRFAGKPGLQPLFTIPNGSSNGNFYGVGPADFATIYNSKGLISGGNDGTGQTIAVVGETNINVADIQAFRQMFGLPANFDSANVVLNGEDPGITSAGEETEADLDVQWSGAVAPGATVKFVVSASTPTSQGIDLSALYIIEKNLAGILSESYGNCESVLGSGGNAFYNSLWEQAAAQGITVILSAGDGGSAGCDDFSTATVATLGLAVSGLASTPYNVALGGTDFDDVNKWTTYWSATNKATTGESALSYIPEIPWNQNCAQIGLTGCGSTAPQSSLNIVAGSGGPSNTYPKPKWQMGVSGMPNDNHRDLPDVSLFASPGFNGNGYIICAGTGVETGASQCTLTAGAYNFSVVGGTSAAAPAFAGVMALVNQYQAAHNGSARQGNANYVLYSLAKQSGASCTSTVSEAAGCVFNDVVKGNSALPTGGAGVGTNSVPCKSASPNCSMVTGTVNGVLVDPAHSTTEAWMATTGYDMVSGLGSVNVNSLTTKWGTVNTVATTTTLTLSPLTGITHGTAENVSVNVTVTPASGTASGDVSLIAKFSDGTTQGLDQFTLASGKITNATTNSLPGGSNYQVYAHYAGDGTNAASDSEPVTVSVAKEASQTFIVIPSFDSSGNQLSGNTGSATYGANYIIRMYVANSKATANPTGPPAGTCDTINLPTCPTGAVTLTDNGTPVGSGGGGPGIFNMNTAGYTRYLTPMLTGGTHTLVASYSGDGSYQPSASSAAAFTVTPAPTQTQIDSVPSSPVQGQPIQIEANVTSRLTGTSTATYPTGTVTFYDGTTALPGPVQITHGNTGQIYADIYNIVLATTGSHSITAQYNGDSNYGPSTSSPTNITVLIPTSLKLSESATTINYGQTVTVTAVLTTSGKGPAITSPVILETSIGNFTNIVSAPGTDANGNQMLTVTGTLNIPGSDGIYALFQGDANYAYSMSNIDQIAVNIPDFSLAPGSGIAVVPVAGQAASAQITVSPSSQTPSSVALALYPSPSISGYTIAFTPQQINLNGAPITATLSLTPTVTVPSNVIRSQARHAGLIAIGRRTPWMASLFTGACALFLLGIPRFRKRYRTAFGLMAVSVIFLALGCGGGSGGGGTGGGGSAGGGVGGTGGGGSSPQATTIMVTTSAAKAAQSAPPTITATVTGHNPTGNVTFYNFGTPIGSGYAPSGAQFVLQGNLSVGVYQLTASYSGDSNNLASTTTTPLIQVITGTIPVQLFGSTGADSHILPATIGLQ